MTLVCANYDHSQWLVARAFEKGCAKPRAQSLDFTSLTAYPCVVREDLLFWTNSAVTQNYTHPEHTLSTAVEACCAPSRHHASHHPLTPAPDASASRGSLAHRPAR